jgi:hypothetical protein
LITQEPDPFGPVQQVALAEGIGRPVAAIPARAVSDRFESSPKKGLLAPDQLMTSRVRLVNPLRDMTSSLAVRRKRLDERDVRNNFMPGELFKQPGQVLTPVRRGSSVNGSLAVNQNREGRRVDPPVLA